MFDINNIIAAVADHFHTWRIVYELGALFVAVCFFVWLFELGEKYTECEHIDALDAASEERRSAPTECALDALPQADNDTRVCEETVLQKRCA